MTRYLLDTDALVDFSKGFEPTMSRILAWVDAGDTLAVCAVSLAEFCAGLEREDLSRWREFLASLAYFEISRDAAIHAGQDRYRFKRLGMSITTADSLLAAVARERDATLVTGNVKHFPMRGVALLSIRE